MSFSKQTLLVVMGVSGCGKSTFTKAISDVLGLAWMDGDDLHLPESVAKMQIGVALNDEDRWPWLERIASYLSMAPSNNDHKQYKGRAVACSALKRAYRDRIRSSLTKNLRFIFLDGDSELIRSRMALRTGHYMQIGLLDSQLQTLERPSTDEKDVITLDTAQPLDHLVTEAIKALDKLDAMPH